MCRHRITLFLSNSNPWNDDFFLFSHIVLNVYWGVHNNPRGRQAKVKVNVHCTVHSFSSPLSNTQPAATQLWRFVAWYWLVVCEWLNAKLNKNYIYKLQSTHIWYENTKCKMCLCPVSLLIIYVQFCSVGARLYKIQRTKQILKHFYSPLSQLTTKYV